MAKPKKREPLDKSEIKKEMSGGELQALIGAYGLLRGKWTDDSGQQRPYTFSRGRVPLNMSYNLKNLREAFSVYTDADKEIKKSHTKEGADGPDMSDTKVAKAYQSEFDDMWERKATIFLRPVPSTHLEGHRQRIPLEVIDVLNNFDLIIDDEPTEADEEAAAEAALPGPAGAEVLKMPARPPRG